LLAIDRIAARRSEHRLQQHPIVLQRPIVADPSAARAIIGRPPEKVLELLQP